MRIEQGNGRMYDMEIDKVLLQKWNHLVINYDRGTLDIFLNNKLMKSINEFAIKYNIDYSRLVVGDDNGIQGGICNVVYYNRSLTKTEISGIYTSLKSKSPPTI